jgi:Holliday junction resolvase
MNSRDKGKRAEREVASALRALGIDDARRGQQFCGLEGAADVVGIDGVTIEVKHRNKYSVNDLVAWLERCQEDADDLDVPLLIHRSDRQPWHVTMYLTDINRLIAAWTATIRDPLTGGMQGCKTRRS